MKIVFVLPTFNPGGAENVMVRLANHFQAQYEVHILVIKGGGILQENIRQSIPVHDLKCDRVRHAFGLLRGRIKSLEPDIVFSSISRLNILLSLIRLSLREKFRLILREVNTPSVALQATGSPGLYKFLYKLLYPRAEVIICQSDNMLGEMQTEIGLVKNKLVRIYNPLNESILALAGTVPENPFASGKNLLSIGRFEAQKGFDLLIEAFARVKKHHPDVALTILGDGPLRDELQSQVAETGLAESIHLPGFEREIYPWLYHATAVVSSSRYEGLPNVLIEAIAVGTPVVATNCPGGTAEIVQPEVNGLLTESNDAQGLADALGNLLERGGFTDRRKISATAEKFHPTEIYAQYRCLFERGVKR